jgi:hypothetical protein
MAGIGIFSIGLNTVVSLTLIMTLFPGSAKIPFICTSEALLKINWKT